MNDELISERLLEVLNKATTIASMGIHVVDVHTREMYFSNEAGFRLINLEPCEYKGLTCHKAFFGRDEPCSNCRLEETLAEDTSHVTFVPEEKKYFMTNTEISKWGDKEVLIEYLTDITEERLHEQTHKKNQSQYTRLMEYMSNVKEESLIGKARINLTENSELRCKQEYRTNGTILLQQSD